MCVYIIAMHVSSSQLGREVKPDTGHKKNKVCVWSFHLFVSIQALLVRLLACQYQMTETALDVLRHSRW
jgi:hypothetical protein